MRFNINEYANYLNTYSFSQLSLNKPSTIFAIFIPPSHAQNLTIEDILAQEDEQDDNANIYIDQDFLDFFGDFASQNIADSIMTGEDFWFVIDQEMWWESSQELSEEERRLILIEALRQREARLQQQSIVE